MLREAPAFPASARLFLGSCRQGQDGARVSQKVSEMTIQDALDLSEAMRRMVGFRNVAVHDYRKLELAIRRAAG